ncbi:MAG: phage recombination protein Bet [Azoarcus sp.]|jgi:phage recombination protein Bet|nr:phage recombination protein Bet [Azoarcus sp.]
MNALTQNRTELAPASEAELMNVLRNSLYPGAKDESIRLVIGYCKAAGLDPMQKPVHIVPMWDSKSKAMRDVVMPGISTYRIQAVRSGCYAGMSDPEFGPVIEKDLGGSPVSYPEWCRVTVRRLLPNGVLAEFAAVERWTENYATAGKDTIAPNAMWKRRPFAQLAKCAEAQALRKGFPEVGAQPTADEMEGKDLDDAPTFDAATGAPAARKERPAPTVKELPEYPSAQFAEHCADWADQIAAGKTTPDRLIAMIGSKYRLKPEQIEGIRDLAPVPA